MDNLLSEDTLTQIQELLTVYGLKVIAALAIFIIGKIIAKAISTGVSNAMNKGGSDPILIRLQPICFMPLY
jgi:Conserved TM helix.